MSIVMERPCEGVERRGFPACDKKPDVSEAGDAAANLPSCLRAVGGMSGLCDMVRHTNATLEAIHFEQDTVKEAVAGLQENMRAGRTKAIEDNEHMSRSMADTFYAHVEKRFLSLQTAMKEHAQGTRELNGVTAAKVASIERSLGEYDTSLKKLCARKRPEASNELQTFAAQIHAMRSDLSGLEQVQGRNFEDQISRWTDLSAKLNEVRMSVDAQLGYQMEQMNAQIAEVCNECAAASRNMASAETRLSTAQTSLGTRLESQIQLQLQRFEPIVKQVSERLAQEAARIDDLERIVKQVYLERTDFSKKVGEDMQRFKASHEELARVVDSKIESSRRMVAQAVEDIRLGAETSIANSVARFDTQLQAIDVVKAAVTELRGQFAQVEQKSTEHFNKQHTQLDKAIGSFDESVAIMRTNLDLEGARVTAVEKRFVDDSAEHKQSISQLHRDVSRLSTEIPQGCDNSIRKAEQANTERINVRMEPVQNTLRSLQELFQEFTSLHDDREKKVNDLDQIVRAVEQRMWPWKARSRPSSVEPGGVMKTSHQPVEQRCVPGRPTSASRRVAQDSGGGRGGGDPPCNVIPWFADRFAAESDDIVGNEDGGMPLHEGNDTTLKRSAQGSEGVPATRSASTRALTPSGSAVFAARQRHKLQGAESRLREVFATLPCRHSE